ncbi:MBL fold metallo-hydrolase [uncultured Planococcus sp.]|uniref:MBL fold metallo-hydrolase n=1 Tax=uncultured Planococcus sp. TaxID=337815 RepID=UPI00260E57BF|nr:MBL fold metallo-hydrolase [uncultured Planococcus sp.]
MSYFQVVEIDDHTWRIEDPLKVYMYLVEGTESALLIDTGTGFDGLDTLVHSLTVKPAQVMNTHGHIDHIGSNYLFDKVYIPEMDKETLKEHTSLEFKKTVITELLGNIDSEEVKAAIPKLLSLPENKNLHFIKEGHIFDLGERQLETIWTPGHSTGSVCLLDKENRQLFGADTVCAQGVLLHLNHSEPVASFKESLNKLYSRKDEFDAIYPGHHDVPIDAEYIREYIECADLIMSGEAAAVPLPESVLGSGYLAMHKRVSIAFKESDLNEKAK